MNGISVQPGVIEKSFQEFIEAETQKQKFQTLVHGLTSTCWDLCLDKPSIRLDPKAENCLTNCVDRFLDTSQIILNRIERQQSAFDSLE